MPNQLQTETVLLNVLIIHHELHMYDNGAFSTSNNALY